jgi:hypothetical protein
MMIALASMAWTASAQPEASGRQPAVPAASAAQAPMAMPPASSSSKSPTAGKKRTQRAVCVKEGASCASPEARCCGNLLCVGGKNSFCAPP